MIIVNNVVSSSSTIAFNYLGSEEIFGYDITANYSVNVSDILFTVGDTVLLEGRDAINTAYKKKNIVIIAKLARFFWTLKVCVWYKIVQVKLIYF